MSADAEIEPLLPCPFCGASGDVIVGTDGESRQTLYKVYCRGCQIRQLKRFNRADAVAAWNRRAPLYSADTIAALRKDAERYRLLRKRVGIIGGAVRATFCIVNLHPTYVAPDAAVELDAAIDAAQSTEGER